MKIPKILRIALPIVIGLLVIAGLAVNLGPTQNARAADSTQEGGPDQPGPLQPTVIQSTRNDTSPPLIELVAAGPAEPAPLLDDGVIPLSPDPKVIGDGITDPSVVQNRLVGSTDMPLPIHNFEGVGSFDNHFQAGGQVVPPDTNGDIGWDPMSGDRYYMQWNNLTLAAWDVTDPDNVFLIVGPAAGNTLFAGFGGPCETTNDGDPIVLFDHLANRWLASQFALPSNSTSQGPFYQCIAVSQTPDPSGSWNRYEYLYSDDVDDVFNDYPKFGVWPDGYYMSANQFTGASGVGVVAFERDEMLLGNPAQAVYFDVSTADSTYRSLLPSDLDGPAPPPGTPNYFGAWHDASIIPPNDAMQIWEFDVDWTTPSNSTFGNGGFPNDAITTANVDPNMCGGARQCVPQPGGNNVDALAPRLMHRLAYRYEDGDHTLIANHTVDVDGTDHAGIHWMELGSSGGPWSMTQEGVFSPDEDHRWMGSIAMDGDGNIALGYSVSSENTYPSIRYAGRLSNDPAGMLPQNETELIAGSGYQETPAGRWGDYSMMSVDPSDDCTFWYTQEYYQIVGDRPWQTRVGSFVFPSCLGDTGTLTGTVTAAGSGLPIEGAQVLATSPLTLTNETATNSSGEYAMILSTGSYTVFAGAYGYLFDNATDVAILSGTTTVQDFSLDPHEFFTVDGQVTDSATGWPLYSNIVVEGDPFDPPAPYNDFWVDPVTGYYTISLSGGTDYTFSVEAAVEGYLPLAAMVGPLRGDVTENFALDADLNLCIAPGYTQTLTFFTDLEADDGGFVAGPGEWEWGTPTFPPGITAFSGVNVWGTDLDDTADDEVPGDSHILTATLAVPGGGGILQWWDWFGAGDSNDHREVTVNGSTVWDDGLAVANQTYWKKQYADLSAWAGQTVDIEFRLNMIGSNPGVDGWYIDDIGMAVSDSCGPLEGGLVVGNVYDDDTGDPLVGATIDNDSGESAMALATPDDPLVDDAFYTIFSITGTRSFTATMPGYAPGFETPTVLLSDTIRQDFYLTSTTPIVGVDPTSLASTQPGGIVVTQPLTVSNSGAGDLDWMILEAPAPGRPLVDWFDDFDSYATGSQIHGQGGWKGWGNDPNAGAIVTDVVSLSSPNSVDIVDTSDLVREYTGYDSGFWRYTAWQYVPSDLAGETFFIMLNQYDDGGTTNNWSVQVHFNGASGLVIADGVGGGATLPLITDQWVELLVEIDLENDNQVFYYDGQFLYSGSWSDGVSGGGILNIGAVDLFANGASSVFYDDISLVEFLPNPCDFPSDLPWVSVSPDTGVTPPGDSDNVEVNFDSTAVSAGMYAGTLCLTSNDPIDPVVEVPISMTVTTDPPAIVVDPASITTTQALTTVVTSTLTISNPGGSDLDWNIFEDNSPSPRMPFFPSYTPPAGASQAPLALGDVSLSTNPNLVLNSVAPAEVGSSLLGNGEITITHSVSDTIIAGSIHCGYTGLPNHTDNSFLRRFNLADFGILGAFAVSEVQVGIEDAIGATGTQTSTINLYTWDPATTFTYGNFTLIGTADFSIPDQALTIVSVPVSGTAPSGATLVVEFFTPDGLDADNAIWPGSNDLGQTDASFIAAAACGLPEPLDLALIGFPDMHLVMNVVGTEVDSSCDFADDIPWVTVSPISGTTAGGEESLVDVVFDSTGLTTGTYTSSLCVASNDLVNPLVEVPLEMNVVLQVDKYMLYMPWVPRMDFP